LTLQKHTTGDKKLTRLGLEEGGHEHSFTALLHLIGESYVSQRRSEALATHFLLKSWGRQLVRIECFVPPAGGMKSVAVA
jgi:hypothetical protein